MSQEEINVSFTTEEITTSIKQVFKEEHQDIMSECIIALMDENSEKMEMLLKCSMGIKPTLHFKAGEKVICKSYALGTWSFDISAMQNAGMIKDDCMEVEIIKADKYKTEPYRVRYTYINGKGETKTETTIVKAIYIQGYAEIIPGD